MNKILIYHNATYPTLTIHADYLQICQGDHCKAAILAILEKLTIEAIQIADHDLFFCLTQQDISRLMLTMYNEKAVRNVITEMVNDKFIERRQPDAWARTYEYKLNCKYINDLLLALPDRATKIIKRAPNKRTFTVNPNKIVSPMVLRAQYTLLERFQGKCAYCQDTEAMTWDHVMPLHRNGETIIENLVPACYLCNSSKGDRNVYEWMNNKGITPSAELKEAIEQAIRMFTERSEEVKGE